MSKACAGKPDVHLDRFEQPQMRQNLSECSHFSKAWMGVKAEILGQCGMVTDDWDRVMRYPPCGKRLKPCQDRRADPGGVSNHRCAPSATRRPSRDSTEGRLAPRISTFSMTSDTRDKLGVRSRRLSKDDEMLTENSEGIVSLASIQRLLKHLVPATSFSNAL